MTHHLLSRLAAAAFFSLATLSGCSGAPSVDRSPIPPDAPPGDITEIPIGSFVRDWKAQLNTPVSQIQLTDDKVLLYNRSNKVYWVERGGGVLASITTPAKPTDRVFAPAILKDRVAFPSTSQIAVYDLSGKLLFNVPLRNSATTGAVGDADQDIILGVNVAKGGRLVSIALKTQSYDVDRRRQYDIPPNWELMTMGEITARPAIHQGLLYAASVDGGVYAVRAENRDVLWPGLETGHFQTGGPVVADLKADKDGVYVGSMDSKLYCLDLNTGRIRWTYYAGTPIRKDTDIVPTPTMVFLYVPEQGLVCIEKAGKMEARKPKWVVPEARQYLAGDDKFAYLRTTDNSIVGVEKATGQIKMRSQRRDLAIFATNTSAKDPSTIYASTAAGTLYSIKPVLKPGVVGEWVFLDQPIGPMATLNPKP